MQGFRRSGTTLRQFSPKNLSETRPITVTARPVTTAGKSDVRGRGRDVITRNRRRRGQCGSRARKHERGGEERRNHCGPCSACRPHRSASRFLACGNRLRNAHRALLSVSALVGAANRFVTSIAARPRPRHPPRDCIPQSQEPCSTTSSDVVLSMTAKGHHRPRADNKALGERSCEN